MGSGPLRAEPEVTESINLPQPVALKAPPKPRRWHWKRWVALLSIMLVLWFWRVSILLSMGHFLDISEKPQTTEYVLVLGGDVNIRPAVAAALYKAGLVKERILVPKIHFSEIDQQNGLPPQQEIIRGVLLARGVPAEAIQLLDGEVDSTSDEAAALSHFLDAHPTASVTIVTTDFHTRRARWLFQRRLGEKASMLRFVSAPNESCSAEDWWLTPEGFSIYLNEYAKLILYCFKS